MRNALPAGACRSILLLLTLSTTPGSAQSPVEPPDWLQRHMAARVTGDTSRWLADNQEWLSDSEPYTAYGTRFWWGPGRHSIRGVLFGIHEGKETGMMWAYTLYWDPGRRKVILAQVGAGGQFGEGEMRLRPDSVLETVQDFWTATGEHSRTRHEERFETTRHTTRSSTLTDRGRRPGRKYLWLREATPRNGP